MRPLARPVARRVRAAHPPGRIGLDRRQAGLPVRGARRPSSALCSWRGHRAVDATPAPSARGRPWPPSAPGRLLASVLLSLVSIVAHRHRGDAGRPGRPLRPRRQRRRPGSWRCTSSASPAWCGGGSRAVPLRAPWRRRRGAHPARPAADGLRDHPLRPDPGGAPGRAAAVAALRLVPPGGRHRRGRQPQPARRGHAASCARRCCRSGPQQDAWHLVRRLLGGPDPVRTPPPRRARYKAPLSFHFLSAGHDDDPCRLRHRPAQPRPRPGSHWRSRRASGGSRARCSGRFGLATVHVDVAGHRTRAEFRDRDGRRGRPPGRGAHRAEPAGPAAAREPRRAGRPSGGCRSGRAGIADPSGRHEWRYWDGAEWTEHVGNGGVAHRSIRADRSGSRR